MNKNFLTDAARSIRPGILLLLLLGAVISVPGQSADKVLATVNGRDIKQHEVDAAVLPQVMPLEQQLYAIRKATLENLIVTSLLEAEANKRGVALEELRKILTAGKVEVTFAEVQSEYEENISAFASMSPDEVKERLRLDLESRARIRNYREAVRELRQNAKVELHLKEPSLPALFNADASPSIGPKDAPITIVEFADFRCPYCRESQTVIKEILKTYPGEVKLIFRHLPLEIHPEALSAARAAFCAGEQNHFWEYHDALFASPDLALKRLNDIAAAVGVAMSQFGQCLNSDASREAVMRDKKAAALFGINSTPTFIVNGRLVRGAIDSNVFASLIEQELRSARTNAHKPESIVPNTRRRK